MIFKGRQMKFFSTSIGCVACTLALAAPAQAAGSAAMAAEYGCVNCHGSYPRGESPSLERLAEKMAKYKGDDAGLAQKVTSYRTGKALEHIDAHERISLEAATALLRWLAEGGK